MNALEITLGLVYIIQIWNARTAAYFAGRGTMLRRGDVGFEASGRVSMYMNGTRGRITAEKETDLTCYHPGIIGVEHAGQLLEPRKKGDGWIRVSVPAGHNVPLNLHESSQSP